MYTIKYLLVLSVTIERYTPTNENGDILGIGYHEVCICDECAAELLSEPQYNGTVKFVNISDDEE